MNIAFTCFLILGLSGIGWQFYNLIRMKVIINDDGAQDRFDRNVRRCDFGFKVAITGILGMIMMLPIEAIFG